MITVTVEYVCDWQSKSGDDQNGHINITTPTGLIEGTWEVRGGKGRGAELINNSTTEYTDEAAGELLNATDLAQGDGTYTADLDTDDYGWPRVNNVRWIGLTPTG